MPRSGQRPRRRRRFLALASLALVATSTITSSAASAAAEPATMVLDWNAHAIAALSNANTATPPGAGQGPAVSATHLAIVQLAVYDAVNAIAGDREAYLDDLPDAPSSASKAAAAATAAHHVLVGLVPALPQNVRDSLDATYAASIASLSPGAARDAGVAIGEASAAAMLADRVNDGRFSSFTFSTGTDAGEWRPVLPAFVNDPAGWVAKIRPFALDSAAQLRTEGPPALNSPRYAAELNEVKTLGTSPDRSTRTPDQEALARFVTASPVPFMNRGLRDIAAAEDLSIADAARLFAMSSSASADALIACWDNKEHWGFWRPITAIREADNDGNPWTVGQADWVPFFATPPYPDEPSGYNCFTGAMFHSAGAFFGTDRMAFSLTSPATGATRTYDRFTDVIRDTIDGRIYTGFHFRSADVNGAWIGKKAAQWVAQHEFEALR